MSTIQPVILSGGSGSRLWPISRSMRPKQLLALHGQQTMLQDTAARLAGFAIKTAAPIVVCNESHRFMVAEQLQNLAESPTIIVEPEGRNTAPAVCLAAVRAIENHDQSGQMPLLLVMPADHVIQRPQKFHDALEAAIPAAAAGNLITFGIVPTYPSTGYGYIELQQGGESPGPVRSFVEKPDLATAKKYVEGGRHFWNSGIFLFRADTYLDGLNEFEPGIVAACRNAINHAADLVDFVRPDAEAFLASPADSIDYALMEKTTKAMMIPMDAGWSDVGSWSALHEIADKDQSGNTTDGDIQLVDCKDSFVIGQSRLVTAVGVENLVIVETKDAVTVVNKHQSESVKELVDQLKSADREEVALGREVFRPWGSYDCLDEDDGFQVKRLIVNPGAVLSLQLHHKRAEHWIVVRGTARITLNDDEFDLTVNESTYIPIGARHRIANPGDEPVHIIEVQCGSYLGEDDIVRFEDQYGREGTTN